MKILLSAMFLASVCALTGCETKVVNQPSPTGQPAIIEHDRPVVVQQESQQPKPEVQNNIHVDR